MLGTAECVLLHAAVPLWSLLFTSQAEGTGVQVIPMFAFIRNYRTGIVFGGEFSFLLKLRFTVLLEGTCM
jgi:hypothetical protein